MNYSGADWIEYSAKKPMSPLGKEVADVLGAAFKGIYHISRVAHNTDWTNPHFIRVALDRGLYTFDSNELTTLVVLSHDRMLRMEINSCNFRHVELVFHPRKERYGSTMTRMPFMEDHIDIIREDAGLEVLK